MPNIQKLLDELRSKGDGVSDCTELVQALFAQSATPEVNQVQRETLEKTPFAD